AGVPLLLEKPPGLNIAETDALISAANKTGAACMVAFNRRHMPVFVKAKEFAGNEVSHVSYDMVRRGRFESDFIITAIHAVDTARWFCGSPFSRVTVNYSEMPEKGESVSNFFLYCTCENGCGADIRIIVNSQATGEKAVLHSRERTVRASVPFGDARTGTGGLFVMEEGNPVIDMGRSEICDAAEDFITNGFYRETEVFFECLTQGKKPADDLESARQSVIVCDALRRRDEWVRF
ncbi:MAG: hypothetical protein FWF03_03190, partial [Defluviitaleaceae bacterium]|nr:hypothetical protein [Defluviitaleaceae bacterium]